MSGIDLASFLDQLWIARWPLMRGLGITLAISALAIGFGSLLGVAVGLALTYGGRALRFAVRLYVDFIRCTPVLVLVLASYYVLSTVGLQLSPFQAGVLALAVFCSSHVGEIVRGALQVIPAGQTDAALSLGLTFPRTFRLVLAPQALRMVLPAWVNTAAEMVKASTLLSIIDDDNAPVSGSCACRATANDAGTPRTRTGTVGSRPAAGFRRSVRELGPGVHHQPLQGSGRPSWELPEEER